MLKIDLDSAQITYDLLITVGNATDRTTDFILIRFKRMLHAHVGTSCERISKFSNKTIDFNAIAIDSNENKNAFQ